MSAELGGLVVTSRTTPAVPAYCHRHETHECAAVLVDAATGQAVGVCHSASVPGRAWCAVHHPSTAAGDR